jgi:DNA-binding response OmpR family regulator
MNDPATRGVVLHVEDDPDLRESLGISLRLAGFRPYAAHSAEEAMSLLAGERPELDVLIVDYHLQGRDEVTGTEVAEAVSRKLGRSLPTIILTGDPANAEIPLLTNAPVWVVRKPADTDTLMAGLPALVEFNRALRRAEPCEARPAGR